MAEEHNSTVSEMAIFAYQIMLFYFLNAII